MARLHTYIHTYIHTCYLYESSISSAAREHARWCGRSGCILMKEDGWMDRRLFWDDNRIAAQSANHFKEQLSLLALRSEETA